MRSIHLSDVQIECIIMIAQFFYNNKHTTQIAPLRRPDVGYERQVAGSIPLLGQRWPAAAIPRS